MGRRHPWQTDSPPVRYLRSPAVHRCLLILRQSSTSPIYGTRRPYSSCTLHCAFASLSPIHQENLRAENWHSTPVSPPTLAPSERYHRLRCVYVARTLLAVSGSYGRLDLTTWCVARWRFILAQSQMGSPMPQEGKDDYGRGGDRQRGEAPASSSVDLPLAGPV